MMENDVWGRIAAPLDPKQIKTRQQSGTTIRYIDARDVFERLNSVVPGQWEFRWDVALVTPDGTWNVKGKLTVCGVTHEDVGIAEANTWGGPAKAAVSDALKRCAVHFGFAAELYGDVGAGHEAPPQKRQQRPPQRRQQAPAQKQGETPVQDANGAQGAPHWTAEQNWNVFWAYVKNDLQLTTDDAHAALGVESIKDFVGEKVECMARLKAYALWKHTAEQDTEATRQDFDEWVEEQEPAA